MEAWKVRCYQDLALDFAKLKADEEQESERRVPPFIVCVHADRWP